MQFKKMTSVTLASILLLICFGENVQATENQVEHMLFELQRATNQFTITIPPKITMGADSQFSLATGEKVTINASYAPTNASVDFGLMDSDGIFHYINVIDGSINQSIQIKEWGKYTLAIRNNSSYTVNVSGFVTY